MLTRHMSSLNITRRAYKLTSYMPCLLRCRAYNLHAMLTSHMSCLQFTCHAYEYANRTRGAERSSTLAVRSLPASHCSITLQHHTPGITLQHHTPSITLQHTAASHSRHHTAASHRSITLQHHTAASHCSITLQHHTATSHCNITLPASHSQHHTCVRSVLGQFRAFDWVRFSLSPYLDSAIYTCSHGAGYAAFQATHNARSQRCWQSVRESTSKHGLPNLFVCVCVCVCVCCASTDDGDAGNPYGNPQAHTDCPTCLCMYMCVCVCMCVLFLYR